MSDERWNDVEAELARLRPAGLSAELQSALAGEPEEERLTFADRVLVTFSALGSVAAAVIVGVIVWQLAAPAVTEPSAAEILARQQRAAEYQQLLASR